MSNLKLNPFAGAMALALPALCLLNGQAQAADVTLAPVTVTGTPITTGAITVDRAALPAKVAATSDTASMLSNKFYYLPTGGAYTGQGATMGINSIPYGIAVPGMGRSVYVGVNVKF